MVDVNQSKWVDVNQSQGVDVNQSQGVDVNLSKGVDVNPFKPGFTIVIIILINHKPRIAVAILGL